MSEPSPSTTPLTSVNTSPPQTSSSSRLRVDSNDTFLRDAANRAWLLRGVNLSGSSKFPRYPVPVPSHVGGEAFLAPRVSVQDAVEANQSDGHAAANDATNVEVHASKDENNFAISETQPQPRNAATSDNQISFVGRPFELSEADEHLARLRHWGFRMIRWVVTWEAVEHRGPGQYDQEFLDYTVKALLKTKEYGFKVMIDFHQDVWSRFSGGSGAPLWTLYAAGFDPHKFAATGAAAVHNTLQSDEPLLRMVWLTNYYKLACASMFTLFYVGKILAPLCTFDNGVNIQDYLQLHFLGAIQALVDRIHECRDDEGRQLLEDSVVLGYDSWNEPSCGWIGLEQLDVLPEQHDMRQGDMPSPFQSLMMGEGLAVQDVATYRLELVGPVKSGSRTINPSAHPTALKKPVKAWLSPEMRDEYDLKYGIRRDAGFPRAGECLWAQHGVWSIKDRKVLQQDYFARGPCSATTTASSAKNERKMIEWVPDHWLPFAKRVIELVRKVHPTAILFLEPPVYVPPPNLVQEKLSLETEDRTLNAAITTNMVYAPHHYDDLVLLTKRYLGWINIDLLGLSRGRHKSLFGSIVLGKKATRTLFGKQIGEIQKECSERLGQRPVLIGETGLHFDVGLDKAQQSGNFQHGSNADGIKKHSNRTTLPWSSSKVKQSASNQNTTATIATTKQFQHAFDNILDGLDRTLVHYTLWNYTIENDAAYGDGWNGENLSLYSSLPSDLANTVDKNLHKWDRGGRAIEQFCRPYPVATVGQPVQILFDRHQKTFQMSTRASKTAASATTGDARTEIYVPKLHFRGADQCDVKVSDGTWEWDEETQILFWTYGNNNKEGGEVMDHWIEIQKKRK